MEVETWDRLGADRISIRDVACDAEQTGECTQP
jgi:hypothetical protein